MTILITGATSGLGRNAVDFLIQQKISVKGTGRNLKQGEKLTQLGCEFIPADLTHLNEQTASELFKNVDTIWHCAALSSPWGKYEDFYQANVVATEKLIHYANQFGIKTFIHVSSPSIYFDFSNHLNIKEDFRISHFVNHYAATKMIAEERITEAVKQQSQTHFIIIRPRAIFGEHDRVLLPRLIEFIKSKNGNIKLPKGGNALLDMTYVLNVIEAMFLATQLPDEKKRAISGNAYNITNQSPIHLNEMLSKLSQGLGINLTISSLPYALLDVVARIAEGVGKIRNKEPIITRYGIAALNFDMTLNNEKAIADLNYKPKYDLETAIQRTLTWYKENNG